MSWGQWYGSWTPASKPCAGIFRFGQIASQNLFTGFPCCGPGNFLESGAATESHALSIAAVRSLDLFNTIVESQVA